jgi:hypothetical protein
MVKKGFLQLQTDKIREGGLDGRELGTGDQSRKNQLPLMQQADDDEEV